MTETTTPPPTPPPSPDEVARVHASLLRSLDGGRSLAEHIIHASAAAGHTAKASANESALIADSLTRGSLGVRTEVIPPTMALWAALDDERRYYVAQVADDMRRALAETVVALLALLHEQAPAVFDGGVAHLATEAAELRATPSDDNLVKTTIDVREHFAENDEVRRQCAAAGHAKPERTVQ